jgi:hypothetical protein
MKENTMNTYKLPPTLLRCLSNPDGFTMFDLMNVINLPENKKFIESIKPELIEFLKKEFPLIQMFL